MEQGRAFSGQMVQILQEDAHAFASHMHYPPTYTPEERAKDIKATGDNIEVALREMGSPSDVRPFSGAILTYTYAATGGTVSYIQSLAPSFSVDYVYQVRYAAAGPGILRLKVMRLSAQSPLEVRGISFELPVSDPGSLAKVLKVVELELARSGTRVTPELRKQIEESLKQSLGQGG